MVLHDLAADSQPDAGAGVFLPTMKPLEHSEDLFGVVLVEPDAVVIDGEMVELAVDRRHSRGSRGMVCPDMDLRPALVVTIFQCIADEVEKKLPDLEGDTVDGRKLIENDRGLCGVDGVLIELDHLRNDYGAIHRLEDVHG